MSWPVTPNGTIILCRQVPFDRQHRNVRDFADAATQAAAIRTYEKTEFTGCSYAEENRVIVEAPRDSIIMCNYMMYRNSGFSNKWFYAFITDVNYVNPDASEIVFEVDNWQTYMFDYQLQKCYVEREHSVTDNIGDNRVTENLDVGEYVSTDLIPLFNIEANPASGAEPMYRGLAFIVLSTTDFFYNPDDTAEGRWNQRQYSTTPQVVCGEPTGLYSYVFMNYYTNNVWTSGVGALQMFLRDVDNLGLTDSIVSIRLVPSYAIVIDSVVLNYANWAVQIIPDYEAMTPRQLLIPRAINHNFSYRSKTYTPKNKKLYTAPFNFLYMTTLDGQYKKYNYEDFMPALADETKISFNAHGTSLLDASLVVEPSAYKGVEVNYDEKMILSNFPNIPCASDSYKAYVAQNANKTQITNISSGLSILGGAAMIAAGAYTANPMLISGGAGMAASGITSIAKVNAAYRDAEAQPDNARGAQSSDSLTILNIKNIYYCNKRILPEYAEIIDNYFTMFGYACHKVKIPNTSSRPYWNYVKTIDCNIVATSSADDSTGLNASAIEDICAIYNRGVTIWHTSAVGNYDLNNQPS